MRRFRATILLSSPLWFLLALAGCGKSKSAVGAGDSPGGPGLGGEPAGVGGNVGAGGGVGTVIGAGGATGLAFCIDQPGALPTAPTGGLPCELIPPSLHQ